MNANMEYFNRVVEAVKNSEYFLDVFIAEVNGKVDENRLFYLGVNTTDKHPSFYVHETLGGEHMWKQVFFDPYNQFFYLEEEVELDGVIRIARIGYSGTEVVEKIVESMREYAE